MSDKPLAIDLFCGLGGWTDGLLLEGWDVIGFDIERHDYGMGGYPAQLVIQDVLTLHGSQFKDADLIVASPPCQNYSYLAMPWSRSKNPNNSLKAKALRKKWETEGPDNRLFKACFRIQYEAILASGRFIPLVVENVRGAIPWVGQSAWNIGSFHLWGNLPALMPISIARKISGRNLNPGTQKWNSEDSIRTSEGNWKTAEGLIIENQGRKGPNGGWFNDNKRSGKDASTGYLSRTSGRSLARKAASAQIAKIPLPLSRHIGRVYFPQRFETPSVEIRDRFSGLQ